ncbi:isochorismatase hydrolase family protein [Coccidioides immitis RMSCC 3703]|uniref:Isochorismatase hydrolase family protein n=1 Tax=Coccidioides immitis RMSCC 3703 TaxID=454286 RepID=A0A0J8TZP6_COCIT|nr:isochorismatase hydrolase family protein [Coccidioides immitis RMSCC 3703]
MPKHSSFHRNGGGQAAYHDVDGADGALIVVDMQEDFCYPNPLGVRGGRELVPLINELIGYPGFVLRIATQDFHPATHISFATNHPAPNNKPFESYITMKNPAPGKESITMPQRLWPVHCVQHTPGAELLPGIEKEKFDLIVRKGMDERGINAYVIEKVLGVLMKGTCGTRRKPNWLVTVLRLFGLMGQRLE